MCCIVNISKFLSINTRILALFTTTTNKKKTNKRARQNLIIECQHVSCYCNSHNIKAADDTSRVLDGHVSELKT